MNRITRAIMVLVLLTASQGGWAEEGGVMISGAWIREAPPNATTLAGYMVMRNHSNIRQILVGATSGEFERIMMHQTVLEGGTVKMVHRHKLDLPRGVTVEFKPGGYHLMLMNPKRRLLSGDRVTIDLQFSEGATLTTQFVVRKTAGLSTESHDH